MQKRKITVVSTKNQKKSVFMSAATTLAELKADLRQNGIDYDGMTFYEGTSKTELKTNESVLPHDVPYKGTITNELVFMLTNTNKKIKSGAVSRADIYAVIKANNLQEECIKKFGKNFTVCKTTDLISLIKETEKKVPSASISKTENSTEVETPNEFVDIKARTAISILTEMLYADDYIDSDEKDEILNTLGNKTEATSPFENYKSSSASPYSDDEISNMFGFVE